MTRLVSSTILLPALFVVLQTTHFLPSVEARVTLSDVISLSRHPRQIADEDDIDTDGPYGYIPRVVHGVNKIVKGVLTGSPHSVFHGAFGIAPDDVAEDLIGTYNQIMGIPDPEDLDLDETTEKGGVKNKNRKPVKGGLTTGGKVKAKDPSKTTATGISSSGASSPLVGVGGVVGTKTKRNKTKPLASKVDEDDDDDHAQEEDDDDDDI